MHKLSDKLRQTSAKLKDAGIRDSEKEAEALLCLALNIDKSTLYCRDFSELAADTGALASKLDSLTARRLQRQPIAYIIGETEFFGLTLTVGTGVLIPRPETELLVEMLTGIIKGWLPALNILDLCTGSGCIAVALAKQFPDSIVDAVDISEVALRYAALNAAANDIRNISFHVGSLYGPVGNLAEVVSLDSN